MNRKSHTKRSRTKDLKGPETNDAPSDLPMKPLRALVAELCSAIERDTALLARAASSHLSQTDHLAKESRVLAARATKLRKAIVVRTKNVDTGASEPLHVLGLEDSTGNYVVGQRPVRHSRRRGSLTPDELRYLPSLKGNIYAAAWSSRGAFAQFRWKRKLDGTIEALRTDSSQAISVSLWGTAARSESQSIRDLLEAHTYELFRPNPPGYPLEDISVHYEAHPNELRASASKNPSLGVVLETRKLVCVVETETLEREHQRCPGFISGRCDGSVANSGRGCPLDVADDPNEFPFRRIRNLLKQDALQEGAACPFAVDNFHNMRVVFAAATLEPTEGAFAVVFTYVGSWNSASHDSLASLKDLLWDVYGNRVVAVDLDDVVDGLLGAEDQAAADLGMFLWRRIRVLGGVDVARCIAKDLRKPSHAEVSPGKGPFKLAVRAPLLPLVPHHQTQWRRGRDGWGSRYVVDVFPFVHPMNGTEAMVTATEGKVRVRVPLSMNGEDLAREAIHALGNEVGSVETAVSGDHAIGAAKWRGELEPMFEVLRRAGFLDDQR